MPIRGVLFDLGETLVDETRQWHGWANWLGVPTLTFDAVLGAIISARRDHQDVFASFGRPIDVAVERQRRLSAGEADELGEEDLYPDAVPTLQLLKEAGYRVGIAANQPAHRREIIESFGLPVDAVVLSGEVGVAKPDPRIFDIASRSLGLPPVEIAFVGDRVDNDVLPARDAGMLGILLRRGPWGHIQSDWPEAFGIEHRIDSLEELVPLLARLQ